jgi:putative transposase
LRVAPSTYYDAKSRPPSARERRDAELAPRLLALWRNNYSVYGRRKLWRAARLDGLAVGRDQVARLMRTLSIRGATRAKRRFTTVADPGHVRSPDLVGRNFTAPSPDRLWVCDFTYCSTWSGVVYVAFVTDVFSRRIVGWKAARSMSTPLVLDALNMAAWTRRHSTFAELVCHTDAGVQYTSVLHTERLREIGAVPSIGTVGDSFDNALAESMFAIFKTELFRNPAVLQAVGGHWKGLDDLEIETAKWVEWFNERRLHSELGDATPSDVEERYRVQSQAEAA